MPRYVITLNDEAIQEFEAETDPEAWRKAVEISIDHRPRPRGSRRWKLSPKGSDPIMWWGGVEGGDSRSIFE